MPSTPLTPEEERHLLATLGLQSVEDLFSNVPPKLRENADFKLDLPPLTANFGHGLSEHELRNYFAHLAEKNTDPRGRRVFLGGGCYPGVLPALIEPLAARAELRLVPSPQTPEIYQGTLQTVFEFQSLIARITASPIARVCADGPTALVDALTAVLGFGSPAEGSACRPLFLSASLPPEIRAIVRTLFLGRDVPLREIPWKRDAAIDVEVLAEAATVEPPSAVVIGSPNFFGVIEPIDRVRAALPAGTPLVVYMSDPSALSIFEPPSVLGADLTVGELRQFGFSPQLAGVSVGFLAASESFRGRIPGPLVAEVRDETEKAFYRVARADGSTSDLPGRVPEALSTFRPTFFLAALGKSGFQRWGETSYSLFDYLVRELEAVGIPQYFRGVHYREGVFEVPKLDERFRKACNLGIVPGIRLGARFSESLAESSGALSNCLLVAVNAAHRREDLDCLVEVLCDD